MHFNSFLLLAIHAAAISAWKIPQGQEDGVYIVTANDDGTTNHTQIASLSTPQTQAPLARSVRTSISRIQRDQETERDLTYPETTNCLAYTLPAADTNTAFNALGASCHSVPTLTSLGQYSISGDVVVYWCNYPAQACSDCSTLGQSCSLEDLSISLQTYLTNACGSFIAGWTSWTRESYGQESISTDPGFCGNGIY